MPTYTEAVRKAQFLLHQRGAPRDKKLTAVEQVVKVAPAREAAWWGAVADSLRRGREVRTKEVQTKDAGTEETPAREAEPEVEAEPEAEAVTEAEPVKEEPS